MVGLVPWALFSGMHSRGKGLGDETCIRLQLCNGSDVDKLLAALEQVIGFHHLSDEVEQKIKKG